MLSREWVWFVQTCPMLRNIHHQRYLCWNNSETFIFLHSTPDLSACKQHTRRNSFSYFRVFPLLFFLVLPLNFSDERKKDEEKPWWDLRCEMQTNKNVKKFFHNFPFNIFFPGVFFSSLLIWRKKIFLLSNHCVDKRKGSISSGWENFYFQQKSARTNGIISK